MQNDPASTTPLPRRSLRRAGFDISILTLGGAGLGGLYGEVDEAQAVDTFVRAVELGINYLDTSPFYGDCERRLAVALRALGTRRDRLHLCTKVGTHPDRYGDYSAEAARWTVERSLGLLGVDYVDVVQVHALEGIDMDAVLAPGGAVAALEQLKKEGRVGAIGLGVGGVDFHRRAIESGRFDFLLMYSNYTLLDQDGASTIDRAAASGLGVLFGRALQVGLLAGGDPLEDPRLARDPHANRARDWWRWSQDRGVSLPAVALQFPLRHPGVSSIVVGASSPAEIEESVRAITAPLPAGIWQEVESRIAAQSR